MSDTPEKPPRGEKSEGVKRAGFSLGAFVVMFGFVWIVFENLALAMLAALFFAGGAQIVQRGRKES
jgi:hypothetical protein